MSTPQTLTERRTAPANPLPWQRGLMAASYEAITDAHGHKVARVYPDGGGPDAVKNSRYIETAVNAYPELVEALRRYVEAEERAAPYSSSPMRERGRALLARLDGGMHPREAAG